MIKVAVYNEIKGQNKEKHAKEMTISMAAVSHHIG